jgi:hypothetical protein
LEGLLSVAEPSQEQEQSCALRALMVCDGQVLITPPMRGWRCVCLDELLDAKHELERREDAQLGFPEAPGGTGALPLSADPVYG